jgi:hypothetical protein
MNQTGDFRALADARTALLDALEALHRQRASVIVVGAQAIYLHTGPLPQVALAEFTLDGDLAVDARLLKAAPLLDEAMKKGGFTHNAADQPGSWRNAAGIAVDLMVPEGLAGVGGRRGARIPPHSKNSARRALGLEAAVVDHKPMVIQSLTSHDTRAFRVKVAGPAALLVAKLHKLGERLGDERPVDNKDAHDVYRLLVAIPTDDLATSLRKLTRDSLAGKVTKDAIELLSVLFIEGSRPAGARMAGQAELTVGEPAVVAAAAFELARDLFTAIGSSTK